MLRHPKQRDFNQSCLALNVSEQSLPFNVADVVHCDLSSKEPILPKFCFALLWMTFKEIIIVSQVSVHFQIISRGSNVAS